MLDHGTLSPSGRVSRRRELARKAAARAELVAVFTANPPTCPQPSPRERLLREAAELRGLAERGMKPRAYRKRAAALEAAAANLKE